MRVRPCVCVCARTRVYMHVTVPCYPTIAAVCDVNGAVLVQA